MSDRETATDGMAEAGPVAGSNANEETTLCWICRQPIDAGELLRWRDEPVHSDCLIHEPRFLRD